MDSITAALLLRLLPPEIVAEIEDYLIYAYHREVLPRLSAIIKKSVRVIHSYNMYKGFPWQTTFIIYDYHVLRYEYCLYELIDIVTYKYYRGLLLRLTCAVRDINYTDLKEILTEVPNYLSDNIHDSRVAYEWKCKDAGIGDYMIKKCYDGKVPWLKS